MTSGDIIRMAREAGICTGNSILLPAPDGQIEALDRFAALVAAEKDNEIERLREGNVYFKEALWAAANRIEKLAFQLPAPNKQTPEFMMLAISIRKIVQGQEQPR